MKNTKSKISIFFVLSLFLLSGCSSILGQVDPNNFEDVKKIISEDTGIPEDQIDLNSNSEISKDALEDGKTKDSTSPGQDMSSPNHLDNGENKEDEDFSIKEASLVAVGDILIHKPILNFAQSQGGGASYDFTNNFALIKDFISKFDYAMANFEGASNPNKDYSTYPMFNVPSEIFKNIQDAGFDGLYTANNHTLDAGVEGISTTLEGISNAGLDNFGTQLANQAHVKLIEVNEIKIGILSYATSLNGLEGYLSSEEDKSQINIYSNEKVKEDITSAKNMGADFIIVVPHWGVEYSSYPQQYQIQSSRLMIENGADIVLGGHPHVVQPSEFYTSQSGHKGYILYSMGNFLSNQRQETMDGDIRTEQGLAVEINLKLDSTKDLKEISSIKEHPLWVRKTNAGEVIKKHEVVLAEDYKPGGSKSDDISQAEQERAQKAYDMTMDTLNKKIED